MASFFCSPVHCSTFPDGKARLRISVVDVQPVDVVEKRGSVSVGFKCKRIDYLQDLANSIQCNRCQFDMVLPTWKMMMKWQDQWMRQEAKLELLKQIYRKKTVLESNYCSDLKRIHTNYIGCSMALIRDKLVSKRLHRFHLAKLKKVKMTPILWQKKKRTPQNQKKGLIEGLNTLTGRFLVGKWICLTRHHLEKRSK